MVLLDRDLALLYEVEVKTLNQAVKRNIERFPADFMFQLTDDETKILRSQIVTSSSWGGRRYLQRVDDVDMFVLTRIARRQSLHRSGADQ